VPADELINPAHAELGSEGLTRLRARHAEVLAAISRRIPNPERQEELRTLAERLNPDTWVTPEDVRAGLDQYEAVLESVRSVIGRRKRRRGRPAESRAEADAGEPEASGTDAEDSLGGEPHAPGREPRSPTDVEPDGS
jgi:hypothetical protein